MSVAEGEKPDLPSTKDRHKVAISNGTANNTPEAEQDKLFDEEQEQAKNSEKNSTTSKPANVETLQAFGSVSTIDSSEEKKEDSKTGKQATPDSKAPEPENKARSPFTDYSNMTRRDTTDSLDQEPVSHTARAENTTTKSTAAGGTTLDEDFEDVSVEDLDLDSQTEQKPADRPQTNGAATEKPKEVRSGSEQMEVPKHIPVRLHEQIARKNSQTEELKWPESDSEIMTASSLSLSRKASPGIALSDSNFTGDDSQPTGRGSFGARPMSPAPGAAPSFPEASAPSAVEPEDYRGLVYYDGVDSMGRPVVIVNADALPRSASRKAAVSYLLQRLEPIVTQGPYVAIFLNTGEKMKRNRLPAGWLAACYRQMSYPFKKNVKHVILVRPSFGLNLMLRLMSPLISRKAHAKIKKVENLSALETATNSEVTLQHLGPRFNTIAAKSIIAGEGPTYGQGAAYQMPNL